MPGILILVYGNRFLMNKIKIKLLMINSTQTEEN